jgi:hypothetical protein
MHNGSLEVASGADDLQLAARNSSKASNDKA